LKKHLNENKRRVLVIGPYPPPIGGVATHIQHLMAQQLLQDRFSLALYRTGKTDENTSDFVQVFLEIVTIFKYLATCRFRKADIFHVHTASRMSFFRNSPYIVFSSVFSKGKVLVHIHGAEFEDFYAQSHPWTQKFIAFVLGKSDGIVVTSERWIDVIRHICASCSRIYPIPNGFIESKFYAVDPAVARKNLNIPEDTTMLLTIGCLEEYKGHKYLVESMKKIIETRNDVAAYIVGQGSLEPSLKRLIAQNNLEHYVSLAGGNKPVDELNLWINACDFFVLPSVNEGNPTVMFEAMACGKPFIGTNVGGIPDIITSDAYGLLCNPRDADALQEIIMDGLVKDWNSEAILAYANEFSWERIARKLEQVYRDIADAS